MTSITGKIEEGRKWRRPNATEAPGPGVLVIFQRNFSQSDGARQIRQAEASGGKTKVELSEDKVGLVCLFCGRQRQRGQGRDWSPKEKGASVPKVNHSAFTNISPQIRTHVGF